MEVNRFRTELGETIFKTKYAVGPSDTWDMLVDRLVEDVCGTRWGTQPKLMSDIDRRQLSIYIKEMKFMPGGRYLYYAGRPAKYYNNCGAGDTKLLTDEGWVRFADVVGQTINVLSPVDGTFKPAVMHEHGEQDLYEYTFKPLRGKSEISYKVMFTQDHKWLLKDGTTTENLTVGDVVPANSFSLANNDEAFAHGFVFGDGNAKGQLRLCGGKIKYLNRLLRSNPTVTYPDFANGDALLYFSKGRKIWKLLPDWTDDPGYIASFIEGWLAADAHDDRILATVDVGALKWFREHAAYAGIVISGKMRCQVRDVKIGDYEYSNHHIYMQNYQRGETWAGFKVVNKKLVGRGPVFCPFEPEFNQIVIDHGIRTYQCYLLRAEEDTREEWSNLSWRAMSCLMTGGGIGADYSRLRASGKVLHRTGGKASGPLPLMHAIDSIGASVMQGGSRRSAIYASLNWQHEDIPLFLKAKNWKDMPLGGGMTVADAKEANFNYKAPLDMTNISVNFDDAWGFKPNNEVFKQTVRQAMETGEPGFSFNFGSKENETLRNACTEVTSEDDSDVCNLGSINMANVKEISEFQNVVRLGSMFLVCGTIRAELPYEKVHQVRAKNRRLGLGLMGMHEWLVQRHSGYEVTPELHKWLLVFKTESEVAANDHCDRFYLSHPVAYRAIAPTGTIGILAGTTTGIEPLFAVAYKRRFLTDGTKWKYKFVVDGAAERVIQEGADPNKLESAADMAMNPEKRIKFQADVQDYVDMSISSTINMPAWGSEFNNESLVDSFALTLSKYAHRLRGCTFYPDGSRGGQPITPVSYDEAVQHKGVTYDEVDLCEWTGKGEAVECKGAATIKDLDEMYARILVKIEQSEQRQRDELMQFVATVNVLIEKIYPDLVKMEQVMDRIERLQNQVDMLMRHTYPTPYKKYQD